MQENKVSVCLSACLCPCRCYRYYSSFSSNFSLIIRDRQSNGDVTRRRVSATIVALKMLCVTYSKRVCSLSYPSCNAHAPYYLVNCGVSGCTIYFLNYLIKGTTFEKESL